MSYGGKSPNYNAGEMVILLGKFKNILSRYLQTCDVIFNSFLSKLRGKDRKNIEMGASIQKLPATKVHILIIESQNNLGWKRSLKSLSPTINLTIPSPP